jgi:hypothetical protein
MPRFVILRHEFPPDSTRESHWDFMLETAEALETWALAAEPTAYSCCLAQRLPDHRKAYLDYEGEVSGGRGRVRRWDAGNYVRLTADEWHVTVALKGNRLRGVARLERVDVSTQRWRFSFEEGAEAIGRDGESSLSDLSDPRGTV